MNIVAQNVISTRKLNMREFIVELLGSKPYIGILTSLGGAGAAVLAWLKILTVIFGFAGALIGFAAGCLTFAIKYSEWKKLNKK